MLSFTPPKPDFEQFKKTLTTCSPFKRVHVAELYQDEAIKLALNERLGLPSLGDRQNPTIMAREDARLNESLGYDMARVHLPCSEFRMDVRSSEDSCQDDFKRGEQGYIVHEHGGPVQNWTDFENYPWPEIDQLDLSPLEWAEKDLPEGMKAYDLSDQVLEATSWLLGYETLFISIYEDPDFVEAVINRVGETYLAYTKLLCDFDCIGAIVGTDDMGYKSQTMMPPDWLRENILPWHRKGAEIAHHKGKLYLLHSCGNVEAIMDDLINNVKIDGKHSFEDEIIPVEDAYDKYGDRVGIIGGIDVDFLARKSEEEVRQRVRAMLEKCADKGRYVLGSGNSITDYIPLEHYLAMLDEGFRFGK